MCKFCLVMVQYRVMMKGTECERFGWIFKKKVRMHFCKNGNVVNLCIKTVHKFLQI